MQNRIIVTLLVCLVSRVATADVVVDQENIGSCCGGYVLDYPGDYIAQTFTANNTGLLWESAFKYRFRAMPIMRP